MPIVKIANQKLSSLIRVAPLMPDFNKKITLTPLLKDSWIIIPYSGCLALEHKIKRGLRALLNHETLAFDDILLKSNNTTIHVKNIQKLMAEFYKYH